MFYFFLSIYSCVVSYIKKKDVFVANRELVAFEGPSVVNGEGSIDPLRVIWADGREREAPIVLEEGVKEFEGGEMPTKVVDKVLEEEDRSVLGLWMNGNLVKLCRCLGMPIEGFEGEILKPLRKMEERKSLKGVATRKRRKFQKVSRSERELKKLQSSVNYCGARRSAGVLQIVN